MEKKFLGYWKRTTDMLGLVSTTFRDAVQHMATWDDDTKMLRSMARRQKSIHEFSSGVWKTVGKENSRAVPDRVVAPIAVASNIYSVLEVDASSGNGTVDLRTRLSKEQLLTDLKAARLARTAKMLSFKETRMSPEAKALQSSDEEESPRSKSTSSSMKEAPSVEGTDSEYEYAMEDSDLKDAEILSESDAEEEESSEDSSEFGGGEVLPPNREQQQYFR